MEHRMNGIRKEGRINGTPHEWDKAATNSKSHTHTEPHGATRCHRVPHGVMDGSLAARSKQQRDPGDGRTEASRSERDACCRQELATYVCSARIGPTDQRTNRPTDQRTNGPGAARPAAASSPIRTARCASPLTLFATSLTLTRMTPRNARTLGCHDHSCCCSHQHRHRHQCSEP